MSSVSEADITAVVSVAPKLANARGEAQVVEL
jgi:hypothetical protein